MTSTGIKIRFFWRRACFLEQGRIFFVASETFFPNSALMVIIQNLFCLCFYLCMITQSMLLSAGKVQILVWILKRDLVKVHQSSCLSGKTSSLGDFLKVLQCVLKKQFLATQAIERLTFTFTPWCLRENRLLREFFI